MPPSNMVLGMIFFSQVGVGVLGNSFFLGCYVFASFSSHRSRPVDPILIQLTVTNAIVLFFQGCPLGVFYVRKGSFLGNGGCKVVFYLQRVSRGLSICTTALLGAFQAVTVSPSHSGLAKLRARVVKLIRPLCLLCWVANMAIEINVPIYMTGQRSSNSSHTGGFDILYCYWEQVLKETIVLPSLRDILCVGGMVWASGYLVCILCSHHQRVRHLHSMSLSPRTSPEIEATHTIVLLVGIFICAYCISCGCTLYKVYVTHSGNWLVVVATFTSLCFPAISPFLLIHRDRQIFKSCRASWQRPPVHS
ncbi:vomeronasal type-1 receptor 4-like [Gracilinanus agilis]|uniref:vomeronasal type-1 receptor 4-like n=1 Tax=Gracilinanus agilis TaxID=191870 RepID=UPI001CFEFCA1|nr:vomeronasal type-1 receptor 4-like [Gracilinanus agilis]